MLRETMASIWRALGAHRGGGLKAPVLTYHSVNAHPLDALKPIDPGRLASHLSHIVSNYKVVSLMDLISALNGGPALPEKSVVLTFDDGYVDNYTEAFPLLQRFRVPATFFIPTAYIEGDVDFFPGMVWRPLNWDQITEMAASDIVTIGAHGHSHRHFGEMSSLETVDDIARCRDILTYRLGDTPKLFAYPNGQGYDFEPITVQIIRELGFRGACSTFWKTTHQNSDCFSLNRIRIDGNDAIPILAAKLRGDYDYIYHLHRAKALLHRRRTGRGYIK